jgi:hypothetical protein
VSESIKLLGKTVQETDGISMIPSVPAPGQIPEGTQSSPDEQPEIIVDPKHFPENATQSAVDYLAKGRTYAFPKTGPPDYPAAIPYLRKAAERGSLPASFELSWVYLQDKSALDQQEALSWLRKAADKGYPDAEFLLGILYEGEFDVLKPNLHLASRWLRRASAHGHAEARKRLAKQGFPDHRFD